MQMCLLCPKVAWMALGTSNSKETAEIKRLQRARRVAISQALLASVEDLSGSSGLLSCGFFILLTTYAERGGLSRVVLRTHHLTRARRIAPTRKPARPFGSMDLPSCLQRDL